MVKDFFMKGVLPTPKNPLENGRVFVSFIPEKFFGLFQDPVYAILL